MNADEVNRLLAEGRTAAVRELRALADALERMPLPDAAEALTWLEPTLEALRRWVERVMGPGQRRGGGTP